MPVLVISKFESEIVISLLISKLKNLKIFSASDLLNSKLLSRQHFHITLYNSNRTGIFQGLTVPLKRSRTTQGQHLNNFVSARVVDATYEVSQLSQWFPRRKYFKVFTIYAHGGHVGHVN